MKKTVRQSNRPVASVAGKHRQHLSAQVSEHECARGTERLPDIAPLVLLVEDDLAVSEMATLLIQQLGLRAALANNGLDGLRLAREMTLAAIVTDVELPGMNGLELCKQLKADPLTADIPILVWSGNPQYRAEAMAAGASDFLTKPGEISGLAEWLRRTLG